MMMWTNKRKALEKPSDIPMDAWCEIKNLRHSNYSIDKCLRCCKQPKRKGNDLIVSSFGGAKWINNHREYLVKYWNLV